MGAYIRRNLILAEDQLCVHNKPMQYLIDKLMPWGPVFFGALIFAPMWSVALEVNLAYMMLLGIGWGYVAKVRGRWI